MRHITKLIFFLLFFPCIVFNSINNIKGQKSGLTMDNKDSSFSSDLKCVAKEKKNPESKEDPIIVKTCTWRKYKFVSTGQPDDKGRYGYDYELFLIDKGKSIKIINSDLFNDKVSQLENLINEKIKSEFDANAKDSIDGDCLRGVEYSKFGINQIGITFNEKNQMEFNVSLGLGSACLSQEGYSVSFELKDIREYLK